MNIKSKAAVKTVTAKKCACAKKCAAKKPAAAAAKKTAEKAVLFTVRAESGKQVYLAGTFNDWAPAEKQMQEKEAGVYTCSVKLAPGTYEYKFVIDGTWCADPENMDFVPNAHGTLNSRLNVK